jgi:hypothetical protein
MITPTTTLAMLKLMLKLVMKYMMKLVLKHVLKLSCIEKFYKFYAESTRAKTHAETCAHNGIYKCHDISLFATLWPYAFDFSTLVCIHDDS